MLLWLAALCALDVVNLSVAQLAVVAVLAVCAALPLRVPPRRPILLLVLSGAPGGAWPCGFGLSYRSQNACNHNALNTPMQLPSAMPSTSTKSSSLVIAVTPSEVRYETQSIAAGAIYVRGCSARCEMSTRRRLTRGGTGASKRLPNSAVKSASLAGIELSADAA